MHAFTLVAAPVDLNHPGHYVHWGVIQISVANLVVIGLMVVIFIAALLLPFPRGRALASKSIVARSRPRTNSTSSMDLAPAMTLLPCRT